jgi:hypothetical protein
MDSGDMTSAGMASGEGDKVSLNKVALNVEQILYTILLLHNSWPLKGIGLLQDF